MSGAFSSVWKAVRELGKPSGSLSFTSRKTSSSSNHDFHLHHVGLEVRERSSSHVFSANQLGFNTLKTKLSLLRC